MPVDRPSDQRSGNLGIKIISAGVFLAVLFPVLAVIGLGAHTLMGCSGGGSSGPVSGCHLFGMEINFIAAIGTPAFVASFLAIPGGVVLVILGAVVSAFSGASKPQQPFANTKPAGAGDDAA